MKIYRLARNVKQYMYFTFDELDLAYKMDEFGSTQYGEPLSYEWVIPKGQFHARMDDETGETALSYDIPEITHFSGPTLILKDSAKKILEPYLEDEGEFFEIDCSGRSYWYYNPTICIDDRVVDLEKSQIVYAVDPRPPHEKVRLGVKSMVLNNQSEQIAAHLFVFEFDGRTQLYCTEKFKSVVEDNGLGGMLFNEDFIPSPCDQTQETYEAALKACGMV